MPEAVVLEAETPLPPGGTVVHVYRSGRRLVHVEDTPDLANEENADAAGPAPGVRLLAPADSLTEARRIGGQVLLQGEEGAAPDDAVEKLLSDGALLAYIEFFGPADAAMLRGLTATGVQIIAAHPVHAYLCRGAPEAFAEAGLLPFVRGVVALTPGLKPVPALVEGDESELVVSVAMPSGGTESGLAVLASVPGVQVDRATAEPTPTGFRVRVTAHAAAVDAILRLPTVIAVEQHAPVVNEDEVANLVVAGLLDGQDRPQGDYLAWLADHGFSGAGVAIGVVDDGVDESHPAFAGRITALDGTTGSHGTMVAGHIAGHYVTERDGRGFAYGLGVAPDAELVSQAQGRGAAETAAETVSSAGPRGARATIQNNSWGRPTSQDPLDYGSEEATLDALVRNAAPAGAPRAPLTICFSVGNKGQLGMTRPKTAKNLLVTGNSENYRAADGGADADDVRQVFGGPTGSSRGNCGDHRIRPDVVAPGEWSAAANHGVVPGNPRYISSRVRWSGGSSAASPKVAGACAVLTEWWRWHNDGATPSPAMLRALVVNQAVDTGFSGPVPNPYQGWGRIDLGAVLAEDCERTYVDQTVLLTDPGEEHRLALSVDDPARPLRVTLSWTDPPGPVGSGTVHVPALVNRLALRVESGGRTYHGNAFVGGRTAAGVSPPADQGTDNLQNVFLAPGEATGMITVVVEALDIPADCTGTAPDEPRQDFALVVDNASPTTGPGGLAVVVDDHGEDAGPTNGDRWVPEEDDAQFLDASRWENLTATPSPDPVAAEEDWWSPDAPAPSEPVAGPGAPAQAFGAEVVAALLANGPAADAGVRVGGLSDGVADLAEAGGAVVVIGDGTRFDIRTLARLRRWAFHGALHLVSTSRAALAFAVARIGRRRGVHLHLVGEAADVAAAVERAVAHAMGCQSLELTRDDGGVEFDVLDDDRGLLLVLRGTTEPKVLAPNGAVVTPPAMTVVPAAGDVIVAIARHGDPWAGRWRVDPNGGAVADAYAIGGPRFRLSVGSSAGGLESEEGGSPQRVTLDVDGAGLASMTVEQHVGRGELVAEEHLTVVPVFVGEESIGSEEGAAVGGSALAASVLPPPADSGPSVGRLTCRVHGVDRSGAPLARLLPVTLIGLEPRRRWLARMPQRILTRARVIEVVRSATDGVVGLTLERAGRTRRVVVRDRDLADALEGANLRRPFVHATVRGDELVGVVVPAAGIGEQSGDRP
jgi:Subtilase family